MTQAPGTDSATRGAQLGHAGQQRSIRLESVRGTTAFCVMFAHIGAITFGIMPGVAPIDQQLSFAENFVYYGFGNTVFFFFALTGYLLFWPFAKRYWGGGSKIDLKIYAMNRILRCVPLYLIAVVVVLTFRDDSTLGAWWRFLTFSENFFEYTAANFLGVAWTLVVEIHYYILLPLLAGGIAMVAAGSRRRAGLALIAIGLVSFALRIKFIYLAEPPSIQWRLNLPTNLMFFVPGMLLAVIKLSWDERRPDWVKGVLARGDAWILGSIAIFLFVVLNDWSDDYLLTFAALLLLGACVLPLEPGLLTTTLEFRWPAYIGLISYSLYIWHLPLQELIVQITGVDSFWLMSLLAIPAGVVAGALSYRYIETPFLRMRRRWSTASPAQIPEAR